VRGARSKHDRALIEVLYAGVLHVSEAVALTWADVLTRDNGKVQLSILGKSDVARQVLLPETVSRSLLRRVASYLLLLLFEYLGVLGSRELLARGDLHHVRIELEPVAIRIKEIERTAAAATQEAIWTIAALRSVN
jgi:integrase